MTALVEDIALNRRSAGVAPEAVPAADPAHPLGDLVLARIAVPGGATRAEIVRDLLTFVSHRLSPAEWRAAAAEAAGRLIAAGLATESRGRLLTTAAGADAVRQVFGGRGALPAAWSDMRDQRLAARALGIEGESAAKVKSLGSPEGLRALVLQKAFGLPLKGNQTANRLRVELAVVALERAFGNKIKGGLGASGGFTAKAGRLLAGQLSTRPRDFGSDGRLIAELAAEQVGAPQSDADALRLAIVRRWVSSLLPAHAAAPMHAMVQRADRVGQIRDGRPRDETDPGRAAPPAPANDTSPAASVPEELQRPGLDDFAASVKAVAGTVAEGWPGNRKAFISRVWQAIRLAWPQWRLSEIEFKCMLAEAHRAGQIVLANADLKDKKSIAEIEASAIAYKNTVWHYVRVED